MTHECFYCKKDLKCTQWVNSIITYSWCSDCNSEQLASNGKITRLSLKTALNDTYYVITLDFIDNTSILTKLGTTTPIYSHDGCVPITPQNIRNKIKTWLIMQ